MLNAGDYKGNYKLIGGLICFDFTNTVSWRETEHPHEWFDSFDNFTKWTEITDILEKEQAKELLKTLQGSREEGERHLNKMIEIREFLFNLFNHQVREGSIRPDDLQRLGVLGQSVYNHQMLAPSGSSYQWTWRNDISPLDKIHYTVIGAALEVITRHDLSRIKKCPSCQWLYMDMSKNKSRRWCTMEDCGNRHKVNAFNQNKKRQSKKAK